MADADGQGPASLLARYHAAFDRLEFEALEQMFAPEAVYLSNGVGSLKGRDEIIATFRKYFGTYAHEESVDTQIEEIDACTARPHRRLLARDRKDGRKVRRSGIETVWFDAGGRIVSVMVGDEPPAGDGPPF